MRVVNVGATAFIAFGLATIVLTLGPAYGLSIAFPIAGPLVLLLIVGFTGLHAALGAARDGISRLGLTLTWTGGIAMILPDVMAILSLEGLPPAIRQFGTMAFLGGILVLTLATWNAPRLPQPWRALPFIVVAVPFVVGAFGWLPESVLTTAAGLGAILVGYSLMTMLPTETVAAADAATG